MPNPTSDFPAALHTNTDVSGFSSSKLGSTSPTHTALEGKQEEEILAAQTKIGTGASTPTANKVLRGTGVGTSAWGGVVVTDLDTGVLDTDLTSVSGSDDTLPSAKATKTALDAKVTGASSSTDNELPRFDGATGKLVQGSGIIVADNGYVQLTGSLDTPGALVSDTISEHTAAAGVTVDGVLLKDGEVTVADEAYGSGWNGSTEVPTKNALYDKIETIGGSVTVEDESLIIGMRFFGF